MSEVKAVAELVVQQAPRLIPTIVNDPALPAVTTAAGAAVLLNAVVTQSPRASSKRIWAAVFAAVAAVLAVPEVTSLLGSWSPVAPAVLSALLAVWSKLDDPRPTEGL